jgi:hypothetical protein
MSPVQMHFWQVHILVLGGVSVPAKYGIRGAITK